MRLPTGRVRTKNEMVTGFTAHSPLQS